MEENKFGKFKVDAVIQEDVVDDLGADPTVSRGPDISADDVEHDFTGFKCIPKNWLQQKNRYKHAGMLEHWENREVLTVARSQRVNLGSSYPNGYFLWFEEQPTNLHFFAKDFKIIQDSEGNQY